jgi:hypothetical protein
MLLLCYRYNFNFKINIDLLLIEIDKNFDLQTKIDQIMGVFIYKDKYKIIIYEPVRYNTPIRSKLILQIILRQYI